jgi:hypothetical protein
VISIGLQIPLYLILPEIRWYRTLINIHGVKNKEANIYDSLIPIERIILTRAFPKIKRVMDKRDDDY